jgi:hypothetical protein
MCIIHCAPLLLALADDVEEVVRAELEARLEQIGEGADVGPAN